MTEEKLTWSGMPIIWDDDLPQGHTLVNEEVIQIMCDEGIDITKLTFTEFLAEGIRILNTPPQEEEKK